MCIFRIKDTQDLPTRCTSCSAPLVGGHQFRKNGERFFSAHCMNDRLCGRSSVWLLVPKRTPLREPGSGVLLIDMFQVETVNGRVIIKVRDQIEDEMVVSFDIRGESTFSHLSSGHIISAISRLLHYIQWSDELFA